MSQIKLTEFLDRNCNKLCPICKAYFTREQAVIVFRVPLTEANLKDFGKALYEDINLDAVDSLGCKFKYMDRCRKGQKITDLRESLKNVLTRR